MKLDHYLQRRLGPGPGLKMFSNSISRSFTAPSLRSFWRTWNPGFGFYLLVYCYRPLRRSFPHSVSLLATFGLCGFAHDLLYVLPLWIRDGQLPFPFVTAWFLLIGLGVNLSDYFGIDFSSVPRAARVALHFGYLSVTFATVWRLQKFI